MAGSQVTGTDNRLFIDANRELYLDLAEIYCLRWSRNNVANDGIGVLTLNIHLKSGNAMMSRTGQTAKDIHAAWLTYMGVPTRGSYDYGDFR